MVLEAAASGLPVVATDVGSVPALIRAGQNGEVVKSGLGVEDRLADALSRVCAREWDPEGVRHTVREYTWEHTASTAVSIMQGEQ